MQTLLREELLTPMTEIDRRRLVASFALAGASVLTGAAHGQQGIDREVRVEGEGHTVARRPARDALIRPIA